MRCSTNPPGGGPATTTADHRSADRLRVVVERLRFVARLTQNPYRDKTVISGRRRCTRPTSQPCTAIGPPFEFEPGRSMRVEVPLFDVNTDERSLHRSKPREKELVMRLNGKRRWKEDQRKVTRQKWLGARFPFHSLPAKFTRTTTLTNPIFDPPMPQKQG